MKVEQEDCGSIIWNRFLSLGCLFGLSVQEIGIYICIASVEWSLSSMLRVICLRKVSQTIPAPNDRTWLQHVWNRAQIVHRSWLLYNTPVWSFLERQLFGPDHWAGAYAAVEVCRRDDTWTGNHWKHVAKWIHALPSCIPICEALENFTGVHTSTSEQHKDLRVSSESRDRKDYNTS